MSVKVRITICIFSFIMAALYALPNLALFVNFAIIAFASKFVSGMFILIFAWHSAKLVELIYRRENAGTFTKQVKDNRSSPPEVIQGNGYSYYIIDDKITFTFEDIIDHDDRQISRLIFTRKRFDKDK